MFKKISIGFLVFVPALSSAQIGNQILRQIDKINKSAPGMPKTSDPCDECEVEKSESGLFETCVQKICVDKKLLPYTQVPQISPRDLAKPAAGEKEIETLLDKKGAIPDVLDISQNREKLADLLKSGQFSSSKEDMDFAVQVLVANIGGQVIKWNPVTYQPELDENKLKAIPLPLNEKNKIAILDRVKAYIAGLPNAAELIGSKGENVASYLETRYPGLSKVDAVKKLVTEFRNEFDTFKQTPFGKFLSKIVDVDPMFPVELVAEIESGKDITDSAIRDLIGNRNSFKSVGAHFISGMGKAKSEIDYEDLRTRMSSASEVTKLTERLEEQMATKALRKEDAKASCISAYRRNLLTFPSKDQIAKLNAEIAKVKKDIAQKWASKYSKQTQKKISEYLNGVDFFLPPEKNDYRIGFKKRLERTVQADLRRSDTAIKDFDSLAFFMALANYSRNFAGPERAKENEEKTSLYEDICEKDKISPLSDANYTLLGKIQLSYTSAQALNLGRGVVAHELGHGISSLFKWKLASELSSQRHETFLKCLGAQQSDPHIYLEEDYADWVAANVTKDNHACIFTQKYSKNHKLVENEKQNDPHSSHFFRLLHVESVQKGKLPKACNDFLVEQGTPKDFMSCQPLLKAKEAGAH